MEPHTSPEQFGTSCGRRGSLFRPSIVQPPAAAYDRAIYALLPMKFNASRRLGDGTVEFGPPAPVRSGAGFAHERRDPAEHSLKMCIVCLHRHCQVVSDGFQRASGNNFKRSSRGNSRSTDRRRLFGRGRKLHHPAVQRMGPDQPVDGLCPSPEEVQGLGSLAKGGLGSGLGQPFFQPFVC